MSSKTLIDRMADYDTLEGRALVSNPSAPQTVSQPFVTPPTAPTQLAADGAIAIKQGLGVITKAGVAALTLALPTAGTDDGSMLELTDVGGHAHTVTTPASGLNGSLHIATFDGSPGSTIRMRAFNGVWYVQHLRGVTLS